MKNQDFSFKLICVVIIAGVIAAFASPTQASSHRPVATTTPALAPTPSE